MGDGPHFMSKAIRLKVEESGVRDWVVALSVTLGCTEFLMTGLRQLSTSRSASVFCKSCHNSSTVSADRHTHTQRAEGVLWGLWTVGLVVQL